MSPTMKKLTLAVVALFALPAFADETGGLTWKIPAGWKTDAEKPMRAYTYKVPAAKGDTEDGEIAVFYFGEGQGGGIDANVDRWVGQFDGVKGTPPRKKEKLGANDVTQVEVEGTYKAGGMMGPPVMKPGFKLHGAIVEGPKGAVFFKFTGPKKTVEAAKAEFLKLLKGLTK